MTASSVPANYSRRHIVAIEPDPLLRALYCDLLEDEGYRVTTLPALDGELADLTPDVILIEDAPSVDGEWPSLAALRQQPPTARTPIVLATTAVHAAESSADHLAALAVHVVAKPFDIDALDAVIAHALAASSSRAAD